MAHEKKGSGWNRIPIEFFDPDRESNSDTSDEAPSSADMTEDSENFRSQTITRDDREALDEAEMETDSGFGAASETGGSPEEAAQGGGPMLAELVATRAELKRLESEVKELKESVARRQADFENYRKRMERERAETYNRAVADIASKLLPVLDNLKRALETEASVEASESDEFRHFLSGVDLIHKQLNGVLEALGVKPVPAVGEHFNPHLHEAVVTEPTEEYEPDTVMQEIVRGFRLGDKLIRPALVKVAVRK